MLPTVEAFATQHGPPLRRPERHGGFPAADGADRGYRDAFSRKGGSLSALLALTRLAAFRFVLETFFGEEGLFAGSPDELGTTVDTPE